MSSPHPEPHKGVPIQGQTEDKRGAYLALHIAPSNIVNPMTNTQTITEIWNWRDYQSGQQFFGTIVKAIKLLYYSRSNLRSVNIGQIEQDLDRMERPTVYKLMSSIHGNLTGRGIYKSKVNMK